MKHLLILLATFFLLVACEKEKGPGYAPPQQAEQTVLIYMTGTSLLSYFEANIKNIKAGMSASVPGNSRILVCYQPRNGAVQTTAELLEIYCDKNNGKATTHSLKSYTSFNAGDPESVRTLFADVAQIAPAHHYGLIIGSHGKAWIPANAGYLKPRSAQPPRDLWTQVPGALATRSFGDPGYELDIPKLSDVLQGHAFKPEYLIFDNCFMASIEVLYDLRGVVDKVIASPCEIMVAGFPYNRIIPHLFTGQGAGYDLPKVCWEFWNLYMNNWQTLDRSAQSGCISLAVLSEIDALADVMRRINAGPKKSYDLNTLQNYEGFSIHAFYDMKHYVESMCDDPTLLSEFNTVLSRAFPANCLFYTPSFYSAYNHSMNPVTHYSGVSISDPSLNKQVASYHTDTNWYKATH